MAPLFAGTLRRMPSRDSARLHRPRNFAWSRWRPLPAPLPPPAPSLKLELPDGRPIRFGDLAHLIADAMWLADGADEYRQHYYGLARVQYDSDLEAAVRDGALTVRNPLTLAPRTFPRGATLASAVVLVDDLTVYLRPRGITVSVRATENEQHRANADEQPSSELVPMTGPGPEPVLTLKQAPAGGTFVQHATRRTRTNVLAPVIEEARAQCADPDDVAQVWNQLGHFAAQERPPFIGAAEGSLKYQDGGEVKLLSRRNLKDRMRRRAP